MPTTCAPARRRPVATSIAVPAGVLLVVATTALGCARGAVAPPVRGGAIVPVSFSSAEPRECPPSALRSVLAQANAARRRAHLRTLVADARLARAARARARTLASQRRLSHAGWESLVRTADAGAATIGENVAYNYPTADAVVRGWLASPGHRANILHASFHRIGVGCAIDTSGKRWWTQDFAD